MNKSPERLKPDDQTAKQSGEDHLAVGISTGIAIGVAIDAVVGAGGNAAKAKK
jgi:hypothetical protein